MTTGSMRPAPKEFRIASVLSKLPFIVPCSSCSRWNKFKSSLARSQYSFTFQQVMRPVYISISSCGSLLRIGEKCRAQRSIGSSEGLGPQFRTSGFNHYEEPARFNHHHFCGILSSSVLDVDAITTPSGIARSSIRAMGTSSVESITIEMKIRSLKLCAMNSTLDQILQWGRSEREFDLSTCHHLEVGKL